MQNKEIHSYKIPPYQKSSPGLIEVPVQKSSYISTEQIILFNEIVSNDICIVKRIGSYNLSRFLILTVVYESGLVFIENHEFNTWGEGNTLDEALKSFEDFFLYDFESYKNTPIEKMDFFARQELKSYKTLQNIS